MSVCVFVRMYVNICVCYHWEKKQTLSNKLCLIINCKWHPNLQDIEMQKKKKVNTLEPVKSGVEEMIVKEILENLFLWVC